MHELDQFDAHPEWRLLLAAYADAAPGEGGWISRQMAVEGLPASQLSPIHGKLIALGLVKFDLHLQTAALQYQLTPLGRQALTPPGERQMTPEWMLMNEAA